MDGLIVGGEGGLSEDRARLLTCKLDGWGVVPFTLRGDSRWCLNMLIKESERACFCHV